jgi:hypothetical protein
MRLSIPASPMTVPTIKGAAPVEDWPAIVEVGSVVVFSAGVADTVMVIVGDSVDTELVEMLIAVEMMAELVLLMLAELVVELVLNVMAEVMVEKVV